MTDNAPYLVQELDRLSAARDAAPGDQAAEMALWEQAAKLGLWFIVNRGTDQQPLPMVLQPGNGLLAAVFSCRARALEAAGERGEVLGVPMPAALDWLASFGERGVTGVVLDQGTINAWVPLANLGYLKRWVPAGGHVAVGAAAAPAAPHVQEAMDTYLAEQSDATYDEVLGRIVAADLLVVLDEDGETPTHMTNDRGDRSVVAFTDTTRLARIHSSGAVRVRPVPGKELLALVLASYDALLVDPMHPSMFVATPDWIAPVLGG